MAKLRRGTIVQRIKDALGLIDTVPGWEVPQTIVPVLPIELPATQSPGLQAYNGIGGSNPAAGRRGAVGLWNPPDSGQLIRPTDCRSFLRDIGGKTRTAVLDLRTSSSDVGTVSAVVPGSMDFQRPKVPTGQIRELDVSSPAALPGFTKQIQTQQDSITDTMFWNVEGYVLTPGTGLWVAMLVDAIAGDFLQVDFTWIEQDRSLGEQI